MGLMRCLIIVTARLESQRFPNKVIHLLDGQPMILQQLDRLRTVFIPVRLIVACADTALNHDILAPLLLRHGYDVAIPKVPQDDVLGRFAAVIQADSQRADAVIRLTGDCPLLDVSVLDAAVKLYHRKAAQYVALAKDWPDGLDVEVLAPQTVLDTHEAVSDPSDREHVTPAIWRGETLAPQHQHLLPCPFDLSEEHWSVDTPEDLVSIEQVYRALPSGFGWRDVMRYFQRHPHHRPSGGRNLGYVRQQGGTDWNTLRYGPQENL
jgi:spore coat polysaccharide biosynthesis protein SpsF (cytidylyltransferase family)